MIQVNGAGCLFQVSVNAPFVAVSLDAIVLRLLDLAEFDDPGGPDARLVHCDATPNNLLVDSDGRITALPDLEWARFGPLPLEIVPWLLYLRRIRRL